MAGGSRLSPANLTWIVWCQTCVSSKFNVNWLVLDGQHQQVLRGFAVDRRLSVATPIKYSCAQRPAAYRQNYEAFSIFERKCMKLSNRRIEFSFLLFHRGYIRSSRSVACKKENSFFFSSYLPEQISKPNSCALHQNGLKYFVSIWYRYGPEAVSHARKSTLTFFVMYLSSLKPKSYAGHNSHTFWGTW